ncbi:MAG: sensor histidine kinase [Oscillochloridaceae bacterium umkhey_bin13]
MSQAPRQPAWHPWVAWGLVAFALLRASLPLAYPAWPPTRFPWIEILTVSVGWSVIGLIVSVAVRLPALDRGVWLRWAMILGVWVSSLSQHLLLTGIPLRHPPLVQLTSASLTSLLIVVTMATHIDRHEWVLTRGVQAAVDLLAILCGMTLLSLVVTPPTLATTLAITAHVPISTVAAVVIDLALIVLVVLLLILSPQALRAILAFLWLMVALRVLSLTGLPTLVGDDLGSLVEPLRASLSGPAVLRWLGHRPTMIPTEQLFSATGSPLPPLVGGLALAGGILTPATQPAPLLGLLALEATRATLQAVRRQHQLRRWWHVIQTERQARMAERAAAQEQLTALARLVHDQAAPLSGLDRIYREIERAGIHGMARRIGDHLGLLLSLAGQLRVALSNRPLTKRPPVRVNVLPIMRAVIDAAAERAQLAKVDIFWVMSSEGATVLGDAAALRRVLDNLVTNALDATRAGGQVAIELWDDQQHPDWLTISVRDTGAGLPEAPPRPTDLRLGLGLGIVHDLTTMMGGVTGGTRAPATGSVCWIRLRYARPARNNPMT